MQIDRRGSYTAIYRDFEGIPMGKPVVIDGELHFNVDDWDYYYICVDIKTLPPDSLGFDVDIHEGLNYFDKVMWEHVADSLKFQWTIISGYGFNQGFNTKIRDAALLLWDLRMKVKGQLIELLMKRMMNSLWGKSIAKIWEVKIRSVEDDKLSQKNYLHCFEDGTVRVRFPPRGVEEKDYEAWFERKYEEKVGQ
jgi:hypothetical protein